jgi:hypothetical protein
MSYALNAKYLLLGCFYHHDDIVVILKNGCTIRYHYNVADGRLAQHVERGIADGLLISCVASCSNLWALIMDAGTGFTNQVYKLSPFFSHKVKLYDLHQCISNAL